MSGCRDISLNTYLINKFKICNHHRMAYMTFFIRYTTQYNGFSLLCGISEHTNLYLGSSVPHFHPDTDIGIHMVLFADRFRWLHMDRANKDWPESLKMEGRNLLSIW